METIRQASEADAHAIARVHVAAWRETYAGLVPGEMIKRLDVRQRAERWRAILSAREAATATFVACEGNGVIGFSSCGAQRDAGLVNLGFSGEISAIYILQRMHRRGVGRGLMSAAASHLVSQDHAGAALWVLSKNSLARGFYERLKGEVADERIDRRDAYSLREIAYGWRDLRELIVRSGA